MGRRVLSHAEVLRIFGVLVVIAAISAMLYGFLARKRHIAVEHIVGPQ
jgi:MFS-type transporter involved in bile tolerance (Atg22 family)